MYTRQIQCQTHHVETIEKKPKHKKKTTNVVSNDFLKLPLTRAKTESDNPRSKPHRRQRRYYIPMILKLGFEFIYRFSKFYDFRLEISCEVSLPRPST